MKTPDQPNNIDLIDILKEPVEVKIPPSTKKDFTDIDELDTKVPNPSDFELPPPQPIQEPVNIPPKKPRLSESEYEEQAEMSIALFDGLQTLTLPWLYQKSMFTRKELQQLKIIQNKKKLPEVELSEEDLILEEKYRTYKEIADAVPYEEKEIELMKNSLAKVFSKYNIQLGPEFLFITAFAYVSIPRYLPLFSKLENIEI